MLRIAVVGSRQFADRALLERVLDGLLWALGPFEVVTGDAQGADLMAFQWANARREIPAPIVYPAYWNDLSQPDAIIRSRKDGSQYDARAGMRRNVDVVGAADLVLAFWDGSSHGTVNVIELAQQAAKPLLVYNQGAVSSYNIDQFKSLST